VHFDIQELNKAAGANIGEQLKISDETYDSLQEVVERYLVPCNRSLNQVVSHPKFMRDCSSLDEMKEHLMMEKKESNSRIPYRFIIMDKYP